MVHTRFHINKKKIVLNFKCLFIHESKSDFELYSYSLLFWRKTEWNDGKYEFELVWVCEVIHDKYFQIEMERKKNGESKSSHDILNFDNCELRQK